MKDSNGFFCDLSWNSLFLDGLIKHENCTKCQVGFSEILEALMVLWKSDFADIPARVLFCFRHLPLNRNVQVISSEIWLAYIYSMTHYNITFDRRVAVNSTRNYIRRTFSRPKEKYVWSQVKSPQEL